VLRGDVSVVSDIWLWDPIPNFRQTALQRRMCGPGRFGSKVGSGDPIGREAVAGAAAGSWHGEVQIDGKRLILRESRKLNYLESGRSVTCVIIGVKMANPEKSR
jgi:hypothetical protein